jgi:ribonuclease J
VTTETLRLIPLGGLGEIGRNMMVLEYDDALLIIDAGIMFPENDMLGVDVVIPDFTYVLERADRVKGIIITHGHEDHIGALPYLLEGIRAPLYATLLTRGLIEVKLPDARVRAADIHTIRAGDRLALPPFEIEFHAVCHSIPDGVGLAITTPLGLVVHSGDFKFDPSPVNGQRTDTAKLTELGQRGVLLLLSDSTNAEKAGHTPSEQDLEETLGRIFEAAQGRVIVTTFASNISRIQQVIDTSALYGRRVAITGRSMVNNFRIARQLGYVHVTDDMLLPIERLKDVPDRRVTLICTGSQGEPSSALVRMGEQGYRAVSVVPGDTVIVSANPIPGNEEYVNRTLDNLFRLGADVYYDEVLDVHVSGHASQEEQKLLIRMLQPRYFVPIHGEYRHLVWHRKLAYECGVKPENIFVIETGDVLEIGPDGAEVVDRVSDDLVLVDGHGAHVIAPNVIEERNALAHAGFMVVTVMVDKFSGGLMGEPQIVSRGFLYDGESVGLHARIQQEITEIVKRGGTRADLTKRLQVALERAAYAHTGRRPVVVPVVTKA